MGATNCPETPRQKMIGMMYLVLTAMLALNVSKDIIEAFSLVDDTMTSSMTNTIAMNESDYAWLQAQKAIQGPEKVKDAETKANTLKQKTDALIDEIEAMKKELIIYVDGQYEDKEGKPKTVETIESKDDRSKPTQFLLGQGNAKKMKDAILKYKSDILALVDDASAREAMSNAIGLDVEKTFKGKEGEKTLTWEEHMFDDVIMAATVTLINNTEGEIRNAESKMLEYIKASISANDFKFDNVSGKAIPNSRMVFAGDKYTADIIVAAYDTKSTPEVYYKMGVDTLTVDQLGSATRLDGENGLVQLEIGAGGLGEQRYAGLIKIKAPDGSDQYYSFSDRYMVVKPSATISADKMNVLYAGIANPISVSAPVAPDQLSVSFPGCNATRAEAGKFNVSVPTSLIGKTVDATVSANMGGKTQAMGTTKFRVKRVPDPRSTIGANIKGGKRSKTELTANPFIRAAMGDDFAYDLKWTINSYQVIFNSKGYEDSPLTCTGAQFSEAVKSKIQKSTSGTTIIFTNIKASCEAGQRTLDEIVVRIK
ncbi:MAG: gliding motility protein GldM [Bacteroidales bacterium]|nr:gliding motility protein GldM [Bacteroidales bacterium]